MPNFEKPAFPFGWRFGLVVAVFLALTLSAAAQVQHGVLTGTVTDQTGAVVPGAEVKATHIDVAKVWRIEGPDFTVPETFLIAADGRRATRQRGSPSA